MPGIQKDLQVRSSNTVIEECANEERANREQGGHATE